MRDTHYIIFCHSKKQLTMETAYLRLRNGTFCSNIAYNYSILRENKNLFISIIR